MPTMHRISCFRDDVIFFIYLYQRWIYKVDKTRGPYGQGEEPTAEQKQVEKEDPKQIENDSKKEDEKEKKEAGAKKRDTKNV